MGMAQFDLLAEATIQKIIRMIRRYLFLMATLLALNALAQSTNKEQPAVQQTVESLFANLTNADTIALKTVVTADVRFYEYGQVWTIDTLIRKVIQAKSIPGFKRTNRFEFVRTIIHHKTAWTTYYLTSIFTRNGKEETVRWMETVVLIKEEKEWKVDVLHSTNLNRL
jgi:hypothetical protein